LLARTTNLAAGADAYGVVTVAALLTVAIALMF
jgi:hypothetical protein